MRTQRGLTERGRVARGEVRSQGPSAPMEGSEAEEADQNRPQRTFQATRERRMFTLQAMAATEALHRWPPGPGCVVERERWSERSWGGREKLSSTIVLSCAVYIFQRALCFIQKHMLNCQVKQQKTDYIQRIYKIL